MFISVPKSEIDLAIGSPEVYVGYDVLGRLKEAKNPAGDVTAYWRAALLMPRALESSSAVLPDSYSFRIPTI